MRSPYGAHSWTSTKAHALTASAVAGQLAQPTLSLQADTITRNNRLAVMACANRLARPLPVIPAPAAAEGNAVAGQGAVALLLPAHLVGAIARFIPLTTTLVRGFPSTGNVTRGAPTDSLLASVHGRGSWRHDIPACA